MFATIVLFLSFAAAKDSTGKQLENRKIASGILDKYSNAKFITVSVEKNDEKLTLGSKSSSEGVIKYASGKFYLSLNSDKKTELYFKDQKLTLVDYPDQDFDKDGIRKVTIISKNTPAFLQSLVHLFSDSKKFFNEFEIISADVSKDILTLNLKPKMNALKQFKIDLNVKTKTIVAIKFVDDVETQTTITFKKFDLKRKISKSAFEYKIQASDQVVTQ